MENRNNIYILIALITLVFSACKKNNSKMNYYESGEIESEIEYTNNKKNGLGVYYYKNGEILSENNYINDSLVGISKFYAEDGTLNLEYNYDTKSAKLYTEGGKHYEVGNVIKDKKNGLWKEYLNKNDKLIAEFYYVDDIKNGPCKHFDDDGNISSTGFFKFGIPDSLWITFDKNGKPKWAEQWTAEPNGKSSNGKPINIKDIKY
jgi:antitoxin component YwqK of YwqJK toxin-antitoxin module